jgi:hypothetical protein
MWMRAAMCSVWLLTAGQLVAQQGTRTRIGVDFKGGTLQRYVDTIRGELASANIVIDGDSVGEVMLPSAPIRTVSLPQALEWVVTTASARRRGVILQHPTRATNDTSVVWVFTVAQAPVARPVAAPEIMTRDHAVDSLPGRADWPQTLKTAVEGKLAKRNVKTGSVEYVPNGRILRVTGTRLDIQDADQTIDELERAQRPAMVLPQLQSEVSRLRQQVDSLKGVIAGILTRLPPKDAKL